MMSGLLGTVVTGRSPLFELRGTPVGSIAVTAIDLVVGVISTPVAIYLTGRYVDRRRFRDFGIRVNRAWWADLTFGFVLRGALMTAIFVDQLALGWVTIRGVFVVGGVPQWTFPYWFLLSYRSFSNTVRGTSLLTPPSVFTRRLLSGSGIQQRATPEVRENGAQERASTWTTPRLRIERVRDATSIGRRRAAERNGSVSTPAPPTVRRCLSRGSAPSRFGPPRRSSPRRCDRRFRRCR